MPIFDDIHAESMAEDGDDSQAARTGPEDLIQAERRPAVDRNEDVSSNIGGITVTDNDGRPMSREELIERLKRGESPTWTVRHGISRISSDYISPQRSPKSPNFPKQNSPPTLLPSVELDEPGQRQSQEAPDNNSAGMEIERPRSALHSGDFRPNRESIASPTGAEDEAAALFMGPRSFGSPGFESRSPSRTRTGSILALPNFVFMPPTSPLSQALNNRDMESPPPIPQLRNSLSPERENRRHTFSLGPGNLAASRRDGAFPYQAHQPRRSASGFNHIQPNSTPQTPRLRPRGTSTSSELSPLHHAPLVGSYEESILRGRMSTTPSRPLNFVAQIGVLGRGKCKASLRCPPHVTVGFPAVFYSYSGGNGNGNGRSTDNQPSPYVGLIDIEHCLEPCDENEGGTRRRRRYASPSSDIDDLGGAGTLASPMTNSGSDMHARALRVKKENLKRRCQSPKAPPGGCYRIPQQGQLQIIIKNPNKTAVKLFLVPYDLSDMEPGQKTFIRQRSYSAGPIIDMPLDLRKNLGTDRPEAALSHSEDPRDRPVLRYLVHLNICCPSKGRYYLYKSIRVVFANRVPDGKEKLRNEVQLPDPKYSTYKPSRDLASGGHPVTMHQTSTTSSLAAEKAMRRRSTPFSFATRTIDEIDGIGGFGNCPPNPPWNQPYAAMGRIRPIPFSISRLEPLDSRPVSRDQTDHGNQESHIGFGFFGKMEPSDPIDIGGHSTIIDKADRESGSSGPGLLTRKLMGLDMENESQ